MRTTHVLTTLTAIVCLWSTGTATRADDAQLNKMDQKFVRGAISGGSYEIKCSELAAICTNNKAVTKFSKHMLDDHAKADQELRDLLNKKKIVPANDMRKQDRDNMEKLAKLNGAAFDREYWKQQIAAHKETIALFEEEVKKGKDADLKAFAEKTLPTLRAHLRSALRDSGSGGSGK